MSQQAKILSEHNKELTRRIEDLCQKRDQIQRCILNEEDEKNRVQHDIRILSDKLAKINESLSKKIILRNSYDKTIAESEAAYSKILQSSHTLLAALKREQEDMGMNCVTSTLC
ncbi:Sjoegren syndrome nuclear autoantigen [Fasciola gigantica]|uniref:Sjoegren syndrome nuclear autoantigen n=2 Tax=Fasciola TaxID=6191 RepID=A0A4E0R0V6_FASHE|nr:Sjoegren syndrome nuclear autoantigen [Fasciola hepatica]TPP58920.1 Sjoegren syndrome nuclear autoantigen [Fasciola gigantica]